MAHPEVDSFTQLYRLADKLIADANKANSAEAARILAVDLAQHQAKYGELPADEYLSLAVVESPTPKLTLELPRRSPALTPSRGVPNGRRATDQLPS